MLVVLSAGLLTVLAGNGVSTFVPIYAEDDECEDNGNNNCNQETQKVHQEVKCKIVNDVENDEGSDGNSNNNLGNGNIDCWNFAQNPQDGDAILDDFPPGPP